MFALGLLDGVQHHRVLPFQAVTHLHVPNGSGRERKEGRNEPQRGQALWQECHVSVLNQHRAGKEQIPGLAPGLWLWGWS